MKTTDYFKATIQNYLEQRAQTDELFAPVYAKENKNIDYSKFLITMEYAIRTHADNQLCITENTLIKQWLAA